MYDQNDNTAQSQKQDSKWNKDNKVTAVIIIMILSASLGQTKNQTEKMISSSSFKEKIVNGEIKKVRMFTNLYYGSPVVKETKPAGEEVSIIYQTVPVNDPTFVPLMDAHHVDYSEAATQNPFLVDFLLSWILPFGFIYIIWKLMAKKWVIWEQE